MIYAIKGGDNTDHTIYPVLVSTIATILDKARWYPSNHLVSETAFIIYAETSNLFHCSLYGFILQQLLQQVVGYGNLFEHYN